MSTHVAPAPLGREATRLAAVARYNILDTPSEPAFDRIAEAAALICGTPIGAVDIVDADRIWTKAGYGIEAGLSSVRQPGLCGSTVEQDEPWVVEDAAHDPRCAGNAVVAALGVRFYAGVPLISPDGHRLGAVCAIDTEPGTVTEGQLRHLQTLAALVVDALELRLEARRTVEREAGLRRQAEELAGALQASLMPPRPPAVPEMEVATRYLAGEQGLLVGGDFFDVFRLGPNDWGILLGDVCGKGARPASLAALARWAIRAAAVHHFSPSAVLADVNSVFAADAADGADDDSYCSTVFARLELDRCGAWLTVANCGHPQPVLVRRSGRIEPRSLPTQPVGLFETIEPRDDRVGLGPGDSLVFYTDGITEARSRDGEFFGEERLLELLGGLAGAPAEEIADAVVAAAAGFAAGPDGGCNLSDDVALLVVRVPDQAGLDPLARLAAATGVPVEELTLPAYPKDSGPGAPCS